MQRDFSDWITTLRSTIHDYKYYVDFDKVFRNVDEIRVELNILNTLVGSPTVESDFKELVARYPEVLRCVPVLLAIRKRQICAIDGGETVVFDFSDVSEIEVEKYVVFMRETGLIDLLSNHLIHNLVDYVTGVEVGLDSNGRKNRGGHVMENVVEAYIQSSPAKEYYKEMRLSDIQSKWGIDLSPMSHDGKSEKRFDFVVKTDKMVYGFETNFYTSGGSKLNETARSYKMLAQESQKIDGFALVWVTDGAGWNSAKGNLRETFDSMTHVYNINDLEQGVFTQLFGQ